MGSEMCIRDSFFLSEQPAYFESPAAQGRIGSNSIRSPIEKQLTLRPSLWDRYTRNASTTTVRGHDRDRHTRSAQDAAMPKAAHVPWRWRAQRKSVYELGGGWELHYEGGKHVLEPYYLEPYIDRLDPKP